MDESDIYEICVASCQRRCGSDTPDVEPDSEDDPVDPTDVTTQQPTSPPEDATTQAPTIPPEDPATQAPTSLPEDPTTLAPTTQAPTTSKPVDPERCHTCLTTCGPCQACTDGPEGSFIFGSCEKCWHCWDMDDDELADDDDDMDKDCDALNKDHDWDDDEVRCLSKDQQDCRACWTELTNDFSIVV